MKTTVIGLGLIGGSLALDLRSRGFASRVVGVDFNTAHRQKALELGLVDQVAPLDEAVCDADLVILAIPVDVAVQVLGQVLDILPPAATVTDMGSTKELICREMAVHPKRPQFVASHPMSGTENSGPTSAVKGLFDHRTAVICDAKMSGVDHLVRVEKMYRTLGMRLIRMSAAEHDLHAAYVSHLSHLISFVLANTVLAKERDTSTIFDLAGGGLESTVRLAKSSPEMWGPIFGQNRENVIVALESYIEHLQVFHRTLVQKRPEETQLLMRAANQIRKVLTNLGTRSGKGKTQQ
ncbi:prephenate dehydrogenase [Bdellovibrionota bacterium FG-1]